MNTNATLEQLHERQSQEISVWIQTATVPQLYNLMERLPPGKLMEKAQQTLF